MPDETMRDATSGETKLAPPWATWAREVTALFEHDEEVTVEIDEDAPSVAIRVTSAIKADALAQIVPTEMQFGNVTLDVAVIPANSDVTDEQVWRWAFDGNPALACTDVEEMPDGTPVTFAMFAPECAQWFADDLTNPLGLQTKTYEQIARDVLVAGEVRITSDVIE